MKNLTKNELIFFNKLKEDYLRNEKSSLIFTMFLADIKEEEKLRKELNSIFQGKYDEIIKNSDILMASIDCCYVGKYKNNFWGTGSEGELYGLGKEIQNIPFKLLRHIADIPDETEDLVNYFSEILKVDYFIKLKEYNLLCEEFNLNYIEDFDYIEKQSEEFNELIDKLDNEQ